MEKVKEFFSENDLFANYVGLEILCVDKGYAKVQMVVKDHHLNAVKTIHGGAIFTLADFAFAVASNSHGRIAMGINASIFYAKANSTGTLFAEAREISLNHKIGNYIVNITDEKDVLVATFQGTAYRKNTDVAVAAVL